MHRQEGICLSLGCFTKNGIDWRTQQVLISHGLEAGKCKFKADTVSGEGCSPCVLTWPRALLLFL